MLLKHWDSNEHSDEQQRFAESVKHGPYGHVGSAQLNDAFLVIIAQTIATFVSKPARDLATIAALS